MPRATILTSSTFTPPAAWSAMRAAPRERAARFVTCLSIVIFVSRPGHRPLWVEALAERATQPTGSCGLLADGALNVGGELLPRGDRLLTVQDGRFGDSPELPDGTHGGNCRHRNGLSTDGCEAGDDGVGRCSISGCCQRRQDVSGLVERGLNILGGEVVHQEVVRGDLVLALLAQEEALHSGEWLGRLVGRCRDDVDREVDARVDGRADVPRTGEPEGGLARGELLLGDVTGDLGADGAGGTLLP